tara:strand:+ start:182 stop:517 length:336 start_codon:yes stop_codon:yes gene_type:complete
MRSLLVVLLLAAAQAGDPPCKWSWKSFGCLPKGACRIKPRFGSWCVATNATAPQEPACDEPAGAGAAKFKPSAKAAPAEVKAAAPVADAAAEEPPSADASAEEETADDEEA